MTAAHLFDDHPYRDPDYAAAVDFCRELIPFAPDELLPGISSANFCPIARTLDRGSVCEIPDELDREWIESNGAGSMLFYVGEKEVQVPAIDEWAIDLVNDSLTDEEIDRYLAAGYGYDESGGEMLRRVFAVPEPVSRFIVRFDAGEFRSLHIVELEEEIAR